MEGTSHSPKPQKLQNHPNWCASGHGGTWEYGVARLDYALCNVGVDLEQITVGKTTVDS